MALRALRLIDLLQGGLEHGEVCVQSRVNFCVNFHSTIHLIHVEIRRRATAPILVERGVFFLQRGHFLGKLNIFSLDRLPEHGLHCLLRW